MALQHGFRLETSADVQTAMIPHSDIVDGKLCGVPITKRGALLKPDEVRALRQWAADNVVFGTLVLNRETSFAILGLQECDPTQEPPFTKIGDTYYVARNNSHNRALVRSRLGSDTKEGYCHDMLHGLWGYADAGIVLADAIIGSLQHRAGAYVEALSYNPDLEPIELPVQFYLPPQFADFIDRGKTRTPADMEYRDTTKFTDELLAEVLVELPEPTDLQKCRKRWAAMLPTIENNVYVRCRGVDVHPSKTQAPSLRERMKVSERFPDSQDLERLILTVDTASFGHDGKKASWAKHVSPSLVATAIVLRSNTHHTDETQLVIDWDYAKELLLALSDSSHENGTGPFGNALFELSEIMRKNKDDGYPAPNDKERMAFLVAAIGQWDKDGEVTAKCWRGKRERKRARTKGEFPVFGGVDIGQTESDS